MAGKVFKVAFEIGGALTPGFGKSVLNASSNLDRLGKKVGALGKIKGDMSSFSRMKKNVESTKSSLNSAREEVRRLGLQMSSTAKPTKAMQREFGNAKKKAGLLEKKLTSQRTELRDLSSELKKAGVSTRKFTAAQAALDARIAKANRLKANIESNSAAKKANLDNRQKYRDKAMGAAVTVGMLGAPLMVAGNFEKAMNQVEAVSGATGKDLDSLRASARKMGAETQFSATQAAEAQNYLAMAGFKSKDIVSSLPGVLNLAAAGNMDLATAADITSDVLTAFGGKSEDMGHLVDVFAKASSSANTNVNLLGESMKYAAAPAKAAGVSLEETTAMLGLMANEGIKGSQAGTALRGALVRLAKQPKETAETLDALGVSVKDANGNMRPMESIMKDLSGATEDMGNADRNAALAKIFGTEALSGMLAVMKGASSGELGKFTDQLKKSDGAAKKMASTMNKGAVGALNRMKSAMESVAIDGGNVLLPTFSAIVEKAASLTGGLSKLAQAHPAITKALVETAAVAATFKVGLIGLGYAWTFVKGGFLSAAGIFHNVKAALLLAKGGQTALTAAQMEGTAVAKAATIAQKAWGMAATGYDLAKQAVATGLLKAKTLALTAVHKGAAASQWALNAAMNANPIGLVVAAIAALTFAGVQLYKNWDLVSEKFTAAWDWMKESASGVMDWFSGVPERLLGWFTGLPEKIGTALSGIGGIILKPFEGAFERISGFLGRIGELWGKLKNAIAGDPEVQKINATAINDTSVLTGVPMNAAGGVATKATLGVYGEAGREYIIPVTSPNDDRGRALWYAAGRDLGLLGGSEEKENPLAKAYGAVADTVDAWDVAMLGKKGIQFAGRQIGGMATGMAAASSGLGRPGAGLGTMAALGAAGTMAFMGLSGFMGGGNGLADAGELLRLEPPAQVRSVSPSTIHITYSPTFHITTTGDGQAIAGEIDGVLRGDMNELIARIREAEEQERRVALE